MVSTLRAVLATLCLRAQCKIIRLLCTLDNAVTVHACLPLGNGWVLTPSDTVEPVPDEYLAPWREA